PAEHRREQEEGHPDGGGRDRPRARDTRPVVHHPGALHLGPAEPGSGVRVHGYVRDSLVRSAAAPCRSTTAEQKTSTTTGSNCTPAHRRSSSSATSWLIAER